MARLKHATDIQYLAFEGGGGKGVAFLGAINALESLKVLPIKRKGDGENQIKGISGASAGAITALFLAMGVKAEDLKKILSRPQDFKGFFDKAEPGIYRSVNSKNEAGSKSDADTGGRRAPI